MPVCMYLFGALCRPKKTQMSSQWQDGASSRFFFEKEIDQKVTEVRVRTKCRHCIEVDTVIIRSVDVPHTKRKVCVDVQVEG